METKKPHGLTGKPKPEGFGAGNKNRSLGREKWPRLNIAINPHLKSALIKAAQKNGMNLTDFVNARLNVDPDVAGILKKILK